METTGRDFKSGVAAAIRAWRNGNTTGVNPHTAAKQKRGLREVSVSYTRKVQGRRVICREETAFI
jgi:hypothetical protein